MSRHQEFPASISAIIFNDGGQILLVSPNGQSQWQVVAGWLEDETIYHGILREIREELGNIEIQLLDILDAHIFYYDDSFPLISVFGLVKYIRGDIITNDDIEGYTWRWFNAEELKILNVVSPYQFEILEKAIFFIKTYEDAPNLPFFKYRWKSLRQE